MATYTLKNIPPELYERLKESAKANRRSINSEIIAGLERQYLTRPVDVEQILNEARALREKTAHYHLTDEEMNQWKSEGRE